MMKTSAAALACLATMLGRTLAGPTGDGDGGGVPTDRELADGCTGKHAWARNSTGEGCYNTDDDLNFLTDYGSFPTWKSGWNNWVEAPGLTIMKLWAKAPGCDIGDANAEEIGTLEVTYNAPNAMVLFKPAPGRTFVKHHLYIGCPKWVLDTNTVTGQRMPTIEPWKFPYKGSAGPWYAIPEVGYHGFSVQAHVVEEVCAECVEGEHVWARNSTGEGCFLDYPETFDPAATWGWTNWITPGTTETVLTLYAKAWNCNIGIWNEVVGTVVVKYDSASESVDYEFFPATGVTFSEYDVYISCDKWQKQPGSGALTVNPTYFHNKKVKDTVRWIYGHGFYVQAHAKRSCPAPPPGPAPGGEPPSPPPIKSSLCPIEMTVNGTQTFSENDCTCSKFSCDSPTAPWTTRNMRFCNKCPAFLEDSYHFSCPHCAQGGTEVSFSCPNAWEACDVFVQAHIQCATKDTDGGLGYNLASEGWVAGSCGPQFCLPFEATCQNPGNNTAVVQEPKQKIAWHMPLFHKQFAGGEDMPIPQFATNPTMYFTFFVREGRFCSNDKNETECAQGPSVCAWDDQRQDPCHASLCPDQEPKPPGGPCCDVASGVEEGNCGAPETAITQMCHFNLPECDQGQLPQ